MRYYNSWCPQHPNRDLGCLVFPAFRKNWGAFMRTVFFWFLIGKAILLTVKLVCLYAGIPIARYAFHPFGTIPEAIRHTAALH